MSNQRAVQLCPEPRVPIGTIFPSPSGCSLDFPKCLKERDERPRVGHFGPGCDHSTQLCLEEGSPCSVAAFCLNPRHLLSGGQRCFPKIARESPHSIPGFSTVTGPLTPINAPTPPRVNPIRAKYLCSVPGSVSLFPVSSRKSRSGAKFEESGDPGARTRSWTYCSFLGYLGRLSPASMPIRALCTICSDFFDHSRDVAAIHCGHTFHLQCLIQWFETAPSRTCPQCRIQVGKRTIINKLFFDLAQEEESVLDAEFLKNELDNIRAQLSQKEREKRDSQVIIDTLRDTLEERNATVESLQKALGKTEMLCSTLKKQMKFLEQQQDETKQAREEARRLRSKMKTMEQIELLLQSQRPEVEEMIRDMGVGQSAVEQLAVYCVSLKKEYENLKEARKASGELADKLRKDLVSSRNKLQTVYSELDQAKLELRSAQKDLENADKEITSLKKKLMMLQETLNLPPVASETVNRLVLESPAPVEMLNLKLHRPSSSDDVDLDATFDVNTPQSQPSNFQHGHPKRLCLEKTHSPVQDILKKMPRGPKQKSQLKLGGQHCAREPDEDLAGAFPSFIRNAVLGQKQPKRAMAESCRSTDVVRTGFDGLGGRTKFIQPTDTAMIRPMPVKPKTKAKQRVRVRTVCPPHQGKLDTFLWQ